MSEKANAPEKLYIDSREHWRKSWTAFTTKAKGDDIEYVRADAFIEKACEWIKEKWDDNYTMPIIIDSVIDEFKNYMKGE